MICFQRGDYLERSLKSVARAHPGGSAVPVVISQDGGDQRVAEVIGDFKRRMAAAQPGVPVVHLRHSQSRGDGYHKLAQHYGWALDQVFSRLHGDGSKPLAVAPQRAIILEEDLEVAPDFFGYFAATAGLLDDPNENLLAVSAWNDNGQKGHVGEAGAVYRSSFFPGLGWMINRRTWEGLAPKWPQGYWDDWLREPSQQQGREVLRPEVCRTYHFATKGVSNNQYGDFLTTIQLNAEAVDWAAPAGRLAVAALRKGSYDAAFKAEVAGSPLVSAEDAKAGRGGSGIPGAPVRVEYPSVARFETVARRLGIMDNVKAGVPRVAYHGVVTVRIHGRKVHVSPPIRDLKF